TRLKPDTEIPLYRQLYEHLRLAILDGQLKTGTKLPSTRALADELGVSRNTILNAYDQLAAEGYLERLEGKGTFVARWLPETLLVPGEIARRGEQNNSINRNRAHQVSERASHLLAIRPMPTSPQPSGRGLGFAFEAGIPALDAFPFELWAKLVSRHAHALHPGAMIYQDPAGHRPLREAIADYVIVARQVHCTPGQVIIVNGSQGALDLAARVLLNPGDGAWMEDPGYPGARSALVAAGADIIPVPVDEEGLIVEVGIGRAPQARLVYLTPSHQFPLGVTMSLKRRLAILDWAKRTGAYVLEDDYDGEYRFDGRPLASLQGLDDHESAIYIGTLSKVLFPALRLGYVVVPTALVDAFLAMRGAVDVNPPYLEQVVLAEFITEGHFTRHIRRMRMLYGERREALLQAARVLPLDLYAPQTGMHLVGWLPPGIDDRAVAQAAALQNINMLPVSTLAREPLGRGGLVMGYAAVNQREIEEGVRRLGEVLRGELPHRAAQF
ncbi:MAG TPA: PLP-dependent aminotransferase family protein, partial [Phototrophicaceae bacterium]|nr:PLP-dependent aminotransferase family protein [Phototrophicaceae bacterium]